MDTKRLLVPTDFTEVAESAIQHAATTAKTIKGSIWLLHIIQSESERSKAVKRMEAEVALIHAIDNSIPVETIVREGNIFDDIANVSKEVKAHLIIMGTHGMKGLQFITGSNALKVVTNSSVPFIIVQEKLMKEDGYDDIVVPITLDKKTKQKLVNVASMARYFNSKVHIIAAEESDEFLRNQVKRNLKYAENYFQEVGVAHTTSTSTHTGSKFVKDVMALCKKTNADLISVMNMSDTGIFNLIGSHLEQELITNSEKIAVMLVNPKQTTVGVGVFSS
jgi:nucleotide-binding universal stress UspA family protein